MSVRLLTPFLLSLAAIIIIVAPMAVNKSQQDTEMEGITFSGENVIQYTLNDQVIEEKDNVQAEVSCSDDLFYLNIWMGESRQDRITFVVKEEMMEPGTYELDSPSRRYLSFAHHSTKCTYASDDYYTGMLMLHELDTARKIIAGSFEFIAYSEDCEELLRVTDGQFDATYSED